MLKEPCPRAVVEGTDWCIFHYPDKNGELALIFELEYLKERKRQEDEHPDFLDFEGFDFPNAITFYDNLPEIFLNFAVFREAVSFRGVDKNFIFQDTARFKEAIFKGAAEFSHATFKDGAEFSETTFDGRTWFNKVTFDGRTWFSKATFNEGPLFDNVTFKGYANFENAIFSTAKFNQTTFKGDARFSETIFKRAASFVSATFDGSAMFDEVTFDGDAWFREATFKGDTKFNDATFKGDAKFFNTIYVGTANFRNLTLFKEFSLGGINVKNNFYLEVSNWSSITNNEVTFNLILLWEPTIEGKGKIIVTGTLGEYNDNLIAGLSLLNTELDRFEFIDADWISYHGRQTIIEEHMLYREPEAIPYPGLVAQIYRRLRENYEKANRYSDAGDFYVGEMEVLRNTVRGNKYLQFKWWLNSIYFYLSKYGESVTLPLRYSLVLILLFAGIRVGYSPSISATLQGFIEALSDSFLAYIQLRSKTTIDLYQRVLSAPLLAMTAVAIKRTLDRK
jgi:uncharacterized protein YjbI with pentapeptide repeats